jgi:hypothetical protein
MRSKPIFGLLFALVMAAPVSALAQTYDDPETPGEQPHPDETKGPDVDGDGADEEVVRDSNEPGGPLPESASDADPQPPVAQPGPPVGMVVKQAGVGGQVGYGRAGVLELGGSAGFTASSDFTSINVTPSIGWFAADNLQLSGRLSFEYVSTEDSMGNDQSGSITTLLVEPSYHLPFTRTAFGFVGMGFGGAYVDGPGLGFAVAPRIGANFMVGRSGVLTPALSWQYTTHETMDTPNGALLVVSSAVAANIGYTVMW